MNDEAFSIMLIGPPGTGKSSTWRIAAAEYYTIPYEKVEGYADIKIINASGERGIDVIRALPGDFISLPPCNESKRRRMLILEEASGLTPTAMDALKEITEEYAHNCIFWFILNDEPNMDSALLSRSSRFYYEPLSFTDFVAWLTSSAKSLGITMTDNVPRQLFDYYEGDIRKCISDCLSLHTNTHMTQWIPKETFADKIYHSNSPFETYLELAKEHYIDPKVLLNDLFKLNNRKNSKVFIDAFNAINGLPIIAIAYVCQNGLLKP
jgi:DNA polymerase III delta prime subunit